MQNKIDRRNFLKKSVALSAGTVILPQIIPSTALGMGHKLPPSDRIVVGAIGIGGMGGADINGFLNSKEAQVVAICDIDANFLANMKKKIDELYKDKGCRAYEDYRQFLAKEKLDAALIAIPDHWHALISIAVANKKIDIYGEKPLARTLHDSRAIVNAVKRNNIIWQTGSWQRSLEHFKRAAELVVNGRIGKVKYVEVGLPDGPMSIGTPPVQQVPKGLNWEMWLGPAPKVPYRGVAHGNWRWILDYSGGQLTDWAGHHIDIAHWGLGFDRTGPIEIEGKGWYPTDGLYNVPVEYDFLCKYANGVEMRVASNNRVGSGATWFGEYGWIRVDRGFLLASDQWILEEKIGDNEIHLYEDIPCQTGEPWECHVGNFLKCIRSRKETITPAETAHRSISVGLLGEIAMTTGQKIKWDPEKEEIIGNEYASRLLYRPYREPWKLPTL